MINVNRNLVIAGISSLIAATAAGGFHVSKGPGSLVFLAVAVVTAATAVLSIKRFLNHEPPNH